MGQPTRGPVGPRATPKQGVTLDVRSYDVFGKKTDGWGPDHAFIVIKDNRTGEQRVLRGGPNFSIGLPRVTAELRPWEQSRERDVIASGKDVSTVKSTWLPDTSGEDAFRRAEEYVNTYADGWVPYRSDLNSNSIASGAYKMFTGSRLKDDELWGGQNPLPAPRPAK